MKMSDGLIGKFEPQAELQKISLQPNEVLIVKIDIDKIDLETANNICKQIILSFPEENRNQIIGIPIGIDLDIAQINDMIDYLEEMKNAKNIY